MRMTYNLLSEYNFFRYDNKFKMWKEVSERKAKEVVDKGFLAPGSHSYYKMRNFLIGTIEDNEVVFYKAKIKA